MRGQASRNIPSERQTVTPCTLSQRKNVRRLSGLLAYHREGRVSGTAKAVQQVQPPDKQLSPWVDDPAHSMADSVSKKS